MYMHDVVLCSMVLSFCEIRIRNKLLYRMIALIITCSCVLHVIFLTCFLFSYHICNTISCCLSVSDVTYLSNSYYYSPSVCLSLCIDNQMLISYIFICIHVNIIVYFVAIPLVILLYILVHFLVHIYFSRLYLNIVKWL